ncbi:hypothetical protein CCP3SC5AM1_2510001 [Gammaproteobacteria bacterium]
MHEKKFRQSFEHISFRIRAIRGGMNQEEFGKLFGLSRRQISTMESMEVEVPIDFCVSLHKTLGISLTWLILGKGKIKEMEEPFGECDYIPERQLTKDEHEVLVAVQRVPYLLNLIKLIEGNKIVKKAIFEFSRTLEGINECLISCSKNDKSVEYDG